MTVKGDEQWSVEGFYTKKNTIHLHKQNNVPLINRPTVTCVHSQSNDVHVCSCACFLVAGILTALDVYSASKVVFSQCILHHTRVIPRILQFCSADLDSGVFPVGDNTCTAESGD